MKWIYKLEYKHGKHYIHNLMRYIVIGMGIVLVANLLFPALAIPSWLSLNRTAILSGQIWRLITFIFVPTNGTLFWAIISLYFYYVIGNSLESVWGGFRLNLYYLFGMLGAIIACFISGYADNSYLNLSLFLAFATIAPDSTFLLLVIPVKAKWLALLYAAFTLLEILSSFALSSSLGVSSLVTTAFSLLGYFLFFGPQLINIIKNQIRIIRNRRQWRGK